MIRERVSWAYITGLLGAVVAGVSESAGPIDLPPFEASFCGAERLLLADRMLSNVSSLQGFSFSGVWAPSEVGVMHWLKIADFATTECWLCRRPGRGVRPSWRFGSEECLVSDGSL